MKPPRYGQVHFPDVPLRETLLKDILVKKVQAVGTERGLFQRKSRIVLAVSGGADSVCMAHVFVALAQEMKLGLHVAHFDHGLRGDESRRDADFVKELSIALRLPYTIGRGDVKGLAKDLKISIQEAARILRYDFLEDVRKETGCGLIATAHTADDQAEEVLARLIRGSGLQGLAGIPWRRGDTVIRPMLCVYKRDIRAFLSRHSLSHVEDSSNLKRKYLRNRIRLDLIPYLKENFNPALTEGLNRTAELLSDDLAVLETMAAEAFSTCLSVPAHGEPAKSLVLSTDELLKYPPAIRRRVYRLTLLRLGLLDGRITSVHLRGIDALLQAERPSAAIDLPHDVRVQRNYHSLVIRRCISQAGADITCFEYELNGPGTYMLPGRCGEIVLRTVERPAGHVMAQGKFPRILYLSAEKLRFPLWLRFRRAGDRFSPLGRGYECKLKKFLINCKVPRHVRDIIPLLFMDGELVAVGGLEVAETVAIERYETSCISFEWSVQLSECLEYN